MSLTAEELALITARIDAGTVPQIPPSRALVASDEPRSCEDMVRQRCTRLRAVA